MDSSQDGDSVKEPQVARAVTAAGFRNTCLGASAESLRTQVYAQTAAIDLGRQAYSSELELICLR